jgi:acetyl esterase/lipase
VISNSNRRHARVVLAALTLALAAGAIGCASAPAPAAPAVAPHEPRTFVYREVDGVQLHAYVFAPVAHETAKPTNAILLFHGGGWSSGSPAWTFATARRFAAAGLVAIAVQYRLSEGAVTPIEALGDACAAFAWTREHAERLGVTGRVAGYGVSAGGHLVAATTTVGCAQDGVGPEALLLWSPALDLAADGWFARLLQGRAGAVDYSPVEHVRESTPPTCIVHGDRDTLTPLSGIQRFHDRLVALGGVCQLNVYPGVGHLLTRNLANQESDYDPDPEARADGIQKHLVFLEQLGFTED